MLQVRYSRFPLVVIAMSAAVAVTLIALLLSFFDFGTFHTSPPQPSLGSRFDNDTLFRSAAPFGHKLAIIPSYSGDEAFIGVGNPSGYGFNNCSVILESGREGVANMTLKIYDGILPHSYDFFKAEVESDNNYRNLLILECKEPYELATSPVVFIDKLDYRPGENVRIKGMVGYSQVTLHILDADSNTNLKRKLATNNGFLQFDFLIPEDAKLGTWSIRVESYDIILSQDFRVTTGEDKTICGQSIQSVKENAPFTLLLPTKLPEGYSLQSVDYVPDVFVNMQFFTRSLCDPSNPYSPGEGVIEIVEASFGRESDAKSGEEYVQREIAKLQASNINATSYVFQNGRMHAVGYWDETYLKARLVVVDDKTGTIVAINARSFEVPLGQLAMIAESLEE